MLLIHVLSYEFMPLLSLQDYKNNCGENLIDIEVVLSEENKNLPLEDWGTLFKHNKYISTKNMKLLDEQVIQNYHTPEESKKDTPLIIH